VHIATGVMLGAQAGIMHNINDGVWLGSPAKRDREHLQEVATLSKLPGMRKEFIALRKQVAELAAKLEQTTASN
jgi:UDP-3-O-[3-hydroxymyristoyl] glucosamine N-acyltransferase